MSRFDSIDLQLLHQCCEVEGLVKLHSRYGYFEVDTTTSAPHAAGRKAQLHNTRCIRSALVEDFARYGSTAAHVATMVDNGARSIQPCAPLRQGCSIRARIP